MQMKIELQWRLEYEAKHLSLFLKKSGRFFRHGVYLRECEAGGAVNNSRLCADFIYSRIYFSTVYLRNSSSAF